MVCYRRLQKLMLLIRNICDLSWFVNMGPPQNMKGKGVTAIEKDGKVINERKNSSLQEKLEIIAKVKAGEKLFTAVVDDKGH